MMKLGKLMLLPIVLGVGACASSPAAQHEVGCVAGSLAGAAIGGAIGNKFGGGNGNTIMTAAGAFAGGASSATAMNCVR